MSAPDWNWIVANLCIAVGAGAIISVFSLSYARAVDRNGGWAEVLLRLPYLRGLFAGFLLVWMGVLIGDASLFQKILWGCIAGLTLWLTFTGRTGD